MSVIFGRSLLIALLALEPGITSAQDAADYRADAREIEALVNAQYAYIDRVPGQAAPMSPALRARAETVADRDGLLRFAETMMFGLADHHAITGQSFDDSWAVVPSYSDLWIENVGDDYVVTAVRAHSPAEQNGIIPGDKLVGVDGRATQDAVARAWTDIGLTITPERAAYAARVLAAGRRDRDRHLVLLDAMGRSRALTLPNLYAISHDRPPVSISAEASALVIVLNDSLGHDATIADFDEAMTTAAPRQPIVIDLTDTPSGGNTVVARAIMGWFVDRPTSYQVHALPAEERETGIPRQWIEQVLPRIGKHHDGPVVVRVGRWTGSMGEGLAIGFYAIGARVEGDRMAGLLGAIYDHRLPRSGLVLKLPTERLTTIDGEPREDFVPVTD